MKGPIQRTKKTYGSRSLKTAIAEFIFILIQAVAAWVFLVSAVAIGVYLGLAL